MSMNDQQAQDLARLNDQEDCATCGELNEPDECPESKRKCRHHCNHSWSHDECCWCGKVWGEL